MKSRPDEIVSVLQREISTLGSGQDVREVGRVLEVGDGIARVYGLSGVMAGEMVEFTSTKIRGLAFNLEVSSVAVIILGDEGGAQLDRQHEADLAVPDLADLVQRRDHGRRVDGDRQVGQRRGQADPPQQRAEEAALGRPGDLVAGR